MSQLNLSLIDPPSPGVRLWDQFEKIHQQIVIEMLARLLLQATRPSRAQENADD